jgi:uncharacterized membrane protein (DUF4010 family)
MEILLFWKLILALMLGALIGAEREYHKKKAGIGIRTMAFISLFGTFVAYFSIIYSMVAMFVLGLVFVSGFGLSMFWYRVKKYKYSGLTTSVTVLLTYFIGAMIAFELFEEAIAAAVIIFFLLFTKKHLVSRLKSFSEAEIINAIEFAIIAFVIYPFIPDYTIFYVNIKQAWWTVILISLISFFGFISMRKLGQTRGTLTTSLFGGIVSTDATTIEILRHYKKNRKMIKLFVLSVMLAVFIIIFRNVIISAAITGDLMIFSHFAKYFAVVAVFAFVLAYYLMKKIPGEQKNKRHELGVQMPFAIKPALYFGLLLMTITAISQFILSSFGNSYALPVSFFAGMASSIAVTASYSMLYVNGSIAAGVLVQSIVAATLGSMVLEMILLYATGEKKFAYETIKYIFILMLLLATCLIV